MKLYYALSAEDYLQYQLFNVTKTTHIIKKRRKERFVVASPLLLIGLYDLLTYDRFLVASLMCAFGILIFIFYPYYQRYYYKAHYVKFAREKYEDYLAPQCEVVISVDEVTMKDVTGESKLYMSELEEINEIGSHIFVRMKGGLSLIFPKQRITALGELTEMLKHIADLRNAKYNLELDWQWK